MTGIHLEKVKSNELELLLDIRKRAFKNLYDKYKGDAGSPYMEDIHVIKEAYEKASTNFLFIMRGKKIIGFSRVDILEDKKIARIALMGLIAPEEVEDTDKEAMLLVEDFYPQVKKWNLETTRSEDKLISFYKSLGYEESGYIDHLEDNFDIVYFEKNK